MCVKLMWHKMKWYEVMDVLWCVILLIRARGLIREIMGQEEKEKGGGDRIDNLQTYIHSALASRKDNTKIQDACQGTTMYLTSD